MTQQEFENLTGYAVTEKEYALLEQVYMYHPAAREKQDIAKLWHLGGVGLMLEMLPRAQKLKEIGFAITDLHTQLRKLDEERTALLNPKPPAANR